MSISTPELSELLSDQEFVDWYVKNAPPEERQRVTNFLRANKSQTEIEKDYQIWLKHVFPRFTRAELADYHHEIWQWIWALERGVRPEALVGIVFRGGAKSSSAEMGAVAAGALNRRKYVLYVSRTQDQADDHVGNIGTLLESPEVNDLYPRMGEKKVGKFGNAAGWRRTRLWTASGFVVDAMGLDSAKRGARLEDQRPDLIIFDDIDDTEDSPKTVRKLIRLITRAIIPAGSPDVAIMFIQNMIHANSIAAQLVSGDADFLRKRKLIGPIPAIKDFACQLRRVEDGRNVYTITSGEPTWEGFGLKAAEDLLNLIGEDSFNTECQNNVDKVEGALWVREQIAAMRVSDHPELREVIVFVDPSGGNGPENDEQGIIVGGLGIDGIVYITKDLSGSFTPHQWGKRAVNAYLSSMADVVLGEKNYGGDMVADVVISAAEREEVHVNTDIISATRGKIRRFKPIAAECGSPDEPDTWNLSRIKLVGSMPLLEEEMRTWTEDSNWSPNRLDAMCWLAGELLHKKAKKRPRGVSREEDAA